MAPKISTKKKQGAYGSNPNAWKSIVLDVSKLTLFDEYFRLHNATLCLFKMSPVSMLVVKL